MAPVNHNYEGSVAAIGEVLWDVFPSGPRFGGAPANFACSLIATAPSLHVYVISAVGGDELGNEALRQLANHGVDTSHVQRTKRPTGQVDINLDDSGVATYKFLEDCAWDNLRTRPELVELAKGLDAVCFGTLAQRRDTSKHVIQALVAETRPQAYRIFDINIRPPFFDRKSVEQSLDLANVLKLNDEELPLLADWYGLGGTQIDQLHCLADRFDLRAAALTRGQYGAVIVRGREVSEHAGVATSVVDTVGAGDAFTAVLASGLMTESDLNKINQDACKVAAYVCSQSGATPPIPSDM